MSTRDDVEQFAALLRRLKERTARSYGSLARRLNMNTSTLHRYCAGEAVPQDYAAVDRLAAFCGASPEERLALHRLWLLAVAARQQSRAGAETAAAAAETSGSARGEEAAETAEAEGAPEPTGGEGASGPDSRTAQGVGPGAPGPGGPGPGGPGPGGPGAGGPGPDAPGPGGPGPGGPGPGAPEPDGPEPDGPEATAQADATRSAGRPWYRRRRIAVGAAAATVLLVTLGSLSALSAGRSHDHSAGAPDQSRTAGTGTSHHPSATASGSSSGRSPASPSAGQRASGNPESKGEPSTGTKGDAGVPLVWTADSQVWQGGCGHDYVIGKEPAQVPPPPVEQDAEAWAATQGVVHGRQTSVQISVQGKSSTAVVLEALRVRVVSRGTPVTGNAYAMGQGCGSDLPPRNFAVDLDVNRPIAHARPGDDSGRRVPAVTFPYRVSAEDPEVLLVTATTEAYDCTWYLELDWSSQGRTGTVRIDDHGRPFRTSGIKGLPHYWYGTNGDGVRQWVPVGS
ncbi:helix-turn-helix domain-containing protein [Streptomyces sp. NPDC007264]|uniref:helix-turn-helix domain-containing protein n=1 Tax=Streptomyces sp. NPDC007264 TaxID=3364777 RepID=UPI0036DE9831